MSLSTKAFYDNFLGRYERGVNITIRNPSYYHQMLDHRLEVFTQEELNKALLNRMRFMRESVWHRENMDKASNLSILIRSDEAVRKYLNMYQDDGSEPLLPFKFN